MARLNELIDLTGLSEDKVMELLSIFSFDDFRVALGKEKLNLKQRLAMYEIWKMAMPANDVK